MASAWAELSKEKQLDYSEKGYTKKSYNDEYGKGGERAPVSNLSAEELTNKWTPNAAAASERLAVLAEERSQNHTASASASTQSSGTQSKYGESTNWDKVSKSGVSDEVKNDPRLQEMVKDPHDGKMKNKYAIKYSSGNIIKNPAVHNLAAVQST